MPKKCGTGFTKVWIPPMLDFAALDLQHFLFVLTMKINSKAATAKPRACNPLTRFVELVDILLDYYTQNAKTYQNG
jgi:hypothetical protein